MNKINSVYTTRQSGMVNILQSFISQELGCTKFQKRKWKLWTYTNSNKSKVQRDYIFVNKKCVNNALSWEAYSSFERVTFDHRIVSASIRLCIRWYNKHWDKILRYYWSLLTISDLSNKYPITVINKRVILFQRHLKNLLQITNIKSSLLPT